MTASNGMNRARWGAASVAIACVLAVAACHRTPQVERVLPMVRSGFAELSESDLGAIVVCHDTLGRPDRPSRRPAVSRCTPCIPYAMQASPERSVAHARRLWMQGARAPYDTLDRGANCVRLAYRYAQLLRPNDDSLTIEIALVDLSDSRDSVRAVALHRVDSILQQHIAAGRRGAAASMFAQLAMGMWDRAQRQLERPADYEENRLERLVHQLAYGAPLMTQLPLIPATSRDLGVSEAEWSVRLFDAAARLATTPADRSRWMRLALAPWVVLERWAALDSAARALLVLAPNDSALLPARALAAYRTMTHPVFSAPSVMALFDTVVAHQPRADSMRFDSFDGVLGAEDDEWRYGFLPDQRLAYEVRGWSVLDPLWSTPVNELRLARRARVAEADYRYADIAQAGEAGSETRPGQVLLRRGAPTAQWKFGEATYPVVVDWFSGTPPRFTVERSWTGMVARGELDDANMQSDQQDTWRVFYGTRFSVLRAAMFAPRPSCTDDLKAFLTIHSCAMSRRADWSDVAFYGRTDRIDVTMARFRARGDSADVYVGARIPLRAFRSREDPRATRADRIALAFWLTTESGAPIHRETVSRELPASGLLAWTQQWTHRVGSVRMMHRVEALEPMQPAGARGVTRFTSDAQVAFPVRGFGMSDVLIAATAAPRQGVAHRWSDLVIQPNGANVPPAGRFAMVWEVYDLEPGRDGRVHWRVRIKRERGAVVSREDMPSVLAGAASAGTRVIAAERSAPDVSYVRSDSPAAAVLENIVFNASDAPVGYNVYNVTIDDLVSGRSVTRGVSVRVLPPESQKRGTKIGTLAVRE